MLMIHHNKLVAKSNFIYDADMPHAHVYIRHVYITFHGVLCRFEVRNTSLVLD
jgi:hypothetical protein